MDAAVAAKDKDEPPMRNVQFLTRWLGGLSSGLFVLAAVVGCQTGPTFDCDLVYLNKSGIALTNVNTSGFDTVSGPGNFPVNGYAEEQWGKRRYPQSCTISWDEAAQKPQSATQPVAGKYTQTLDLSAIPNDQRVGKLTFEFSPQKKWSASFQANPK